MLHFALTILQFICAAMIVLLVLVQKGKGAEAGAGFGSGASGTVFGARGAGTALSRATAIFAAVFMLNSLALGYVGSHVSTAQQQPQSLLEKAGQTQRPLSRAMPGSVPLPNKGAIPGAPPAPAPAAPTSGGSGSSGAKP